MRVFGVAFCLIAASLSGLPMASSSEELGREEVEARIESILRDFVEYEVEFKGESFRSRRYLYFIDTSKSKFLTDKFVVPIVYNRGTGVYRTEVSIEAEKIEFRTTKRDQIEWGTGRPDNRASSFSSKFKKVMDEDTRVELQGLFDHLADLIEGPGKSDG